MTPGRIVVDGRRRLRQDDDRRGAGRPPRPPVHRVRRAPLPRRTSRRWPRACRSTDDDRWPWLAAVRRAMRGEDQVVVACSALRRGYRDALRAADDVGFVYLAVDRGEALRRVAGRTDHFMGAAMVDSQFDDARAARPRRARRGVGRRGRRLGRRSSAASRRRSRRSGPALRPRRSAASAARSTRSRATSCARSSRRSPATEVRRRGRPSRPARPARPHPAPLPGGPDHGTLFEGLIAAGCEVAVLPAVGTHAPMTPDECACCSATASRRRASSPPLARRRRARSARSTPPRSRAVRRPPHRADPGRGRRAAARRLGPRRLDRAGRAARGDRHGQLHQEPRDRPRRRADHPPQPLPRSASATSRRSWVGPTRPSATWSTRAFDRFLAGRIRCSGS